MWPLSLTCINLRGLASQLGYFTKKGRHTGMSITLFTWYNLSNQKAKWPCFLTSPSSYLALASLALLQPGAVSQHPAASKPWLNNQLGGPQNTFSSDKPLASFSHLENLTLNFLSGAPFWGSTFSPELESFHIICDQLRGSKNFRLAKVG